MCHVASRYKPLRNEALIGQEQRDLTQDIRRLLVQSATPTRNDDGARGPGRGGNQWRPKATITDRLVTFVFTKAKRQTVPSEQRRSKIPKSVLSSASQMALFGPSSRKHNYCRLASASLSTTSLLVITNPDWLYLNSCSKSTIKSELFPQHYQSMQIQETRCESTPTAGPKTTINSAAPLKFFPFDVYYNPKSMANILALKVIACRSFSKSQWTHDRRAHDAGPRLQGQQ
jgi:hypothetical protein